MDDKSDDNKGNKDDLLWRWRHIMIVMMRYDSDEELWWITRYDGGDALWVMTRYDSDELWWWLQIMMVMTRYDNDDALW